MSTVPENLAYTSDHEWVAVDGETARVGITAYAADQLGEAVYLDPPALGDTVVAGTPSGEIESTKAVSDLVAPADGEVVEVNDAAVENPEIVTSDPYGEGWIYAVRLHATPELLDAAAYRALVEGQGA